MPLTELTKDEAKALLVDGFEIHTFRDAMVPGPGGPTHIVLGADHERERVLGLIDRWPCYKSGPMATGMGHGLCIHDGQNDPLFVATKEESD
jgi:hypothetical protein